MSDSVIPSEHLYRLYYFSRARTNRFKTGIGGLWQHVTGAHARIARENEREALECLQRDRAQRDKLIFVQLKERQKLERQIRTVRARYARTFVEVRADRRETRANPQQRASRCCGLHIIIDSA